MKNMNYGYCDACGKALTEHYFSLDRHVEKLLCHGDMSVDSVELTAEILEAETLFSYCSSKCAWPVALKTLSEWGVRHTGGRVGPVEPCAKCNAPIFFINPHIAYSMLEQTEDRQQKVFSIHVHEAFGLAEVCLKCGGGFEAKTISVEEQINEEKIICGS